MPSAEEQIRREAELARRLESSSEAERQCLYGRMYDEIYEMHLDRNPDVLDFGASKRFVPFLARQAGPGQRVLEVGCGTGLLAIELARLGRRVAGVDVSEVALEVARSRSGGFEGLEFLKVSGVQVPFPDASFDLAFSLEVVEHLHPQDVAPHLREMCRILTPQGRYVFWTPNAHESLTAAERFGLQDHEVAAETGDVHLKEWTYRELEDALHDAGFVDLKAPWHLGYPKLPLIPLRACVLGERLATRARARRFVKRVLPGISHCGVAAARQR